MVTNLPVSMEETAKAFLNRCAEAIREPEFAAFVYENARGQEEPTFPWARLGGSIMVSVTEITNQEYARHPDIAYNSLVRVKVIHLANSFAAKITRARASSCRDWIFTPEEPVRVPAVRPGGPFEWLLGVWWADPRELEEAKSIGEAMERERRVWEARREE
jgi:hypothetical protein